MNFILDKIYKYVLLRNAVKTSSSAVTVGASTPTGSATTTMTVGMVPTRVRSAAAAPQSLRAVTPNASTSATGTVLSIYCYFTG